MNKQLKADLCLLGVTLIWGASFTLMKEGIKDIPPYTFLAIRYTIGFLLLGAVFYKRMMKINKRALKYGMLIGITLSGGGIFQIIGLQYTTASKSGFITGLAVVFVPLITSVISKKVPGVKTVIGIIVATAGLGLLTLSGDISINKGDILTIVCSLFFAFQIIFVDKFAPGLDSVILTVIEMATIAVISGAAGVIFEGFSASLTPNSIFSILYTGILCSALAYWVQMDMQKDTSPTHAALIFLGEPVFSAVIAAIFIGETMTYMMIIGSMLILASMFITETTT